jgi:hypothetical protein
MKLLLSNLCIFIEKVIPTALPQYADETITQTACITNPRRQSHSAEWIIGMCGIPHENNPADAELVRTTLMEFVWGKHFELVFQGSGSGEHCLVFGFEVGTGLFIR